MVQVTTGPIANLSTRISQLCYICRWTTIILSAAQFSLNSRYFLNLSHINAKLTLLSYVHASKLLYFFSANVHHYYSNYSYGDVRFGNSSH